MYPPAGFAWECGSGSSTGSSAPAEEQAEEPGKVCCHSFLTSAASQLPGGDLRAVEALPGGGGTWEATLPVSYCLWVTRTGTGHRAARRMGEMQVAAWHGKWW